MSSLGMSKYNLVCKVPKKNFIKTEVPLLFLKKYGFVVNSAKSLLSHFIMHMVHVNHCVLLN
jgi:hypothetical protein